jgi:hypothetical protein
LEPGNSPSGAIRVELTGTARGAVDDDCEFANHAVDAHGKDVFDEHAAELGELFAKPAAVAVHNAQILAHALALTAQLQTALSTRPVVDQAIGLIRGRSGRSAEEAFTQLRAISQAEHRKLADVAQHIVDEAVRRARARRNPT